MALLRVTIALALAGGVATADDVPSKQSVQLPSSMTDGSKLSIAPLHVPAEESGPDRRPLLVGAGIVLLAAAFWMNRRQRDRFDDDAKPRRRRRRGGDDGDDLHAAARGEETPDE